MTGIGREKAEQIWFIALDQYFVSNTSYVNTTTPSNTARAYTLSAADDLYGICSTEYKAVQASWTAVGVAGSDAECLAENDFSLRLSPATVSLSAGESTTVTAETTVTNGEAEEIAFTSGAAPAGSPCPSSPPP